MYGAELAVNLIYLSIFLLTIHYKIENRKKKQLAIAIAVPPYCVDAVILQVCDS